MCMIKDSQCTQTNKFAITIQYILGKTLAMEFMFSNIYQSFYKLALSFLMDVWPDISKVPKIGSWQYSCNILRKKCRSCFLLYCDAKHSDILSRFIHNCCYLIFFIICFSFISPYDLLNYLTNVYILQCFVKLFKFVVFG